ncbi:MAG: thioredoxin family protein [Ruminococcaceae bacterium]|nr:thioredoxin family protein [Oscillospiraceae bacterium]
MTELTYKNFGAKVEAAGLPLVIEFSDEPTLPQELTERHKERYEFYRVDASKQKRLAKNFQLISVPTSILLRDGKVMQRVRGERSYEQWCRILDLD